MLDFIKSKKSLKSLFHDHRGKIADKWESYLHVYEDEFVKYRNTQYPILEIGVQNCGSLEIWAKYFNNSQKIIGVDILDELKELEFEDKRVEVEICDATDLYLNYLHNFKRTIVIIDDASHKSTDIVKTFITMFSHLRDGGVYVVEDLCCSYWAEFNEKLTLSSMSFFKALTDIINFEHWNQIEKLKSYIGSTNLTNFEQMYTIMTTIKSVRFYNSMCFIEKYSQSSINSIGKRVVTGNQVPLGLKANNGQSINDLSVTHRDFEFDDSDLLK